MEQGLGKSAVLLADFEQMRLAGQVDALLVITLNQLKWAWSDEHIPAWAPNLQVATWSDRHWEGPDDVDVFAINYEAVVTGGAKDVQKILETNRVMLAVDECHRIKDYNSSWAKKILTLAKSAAYTRGLTGSPTGGMVTDFFPQLKLAKATEVDGWNSKAFRNRYAIMAGFKGRQVVDYNKDTKPELDSVLDQYSFRALKSEYTDLPPKLPAVTIKVDLPRDLLSHYRTMHDDFMVYLDAADPSDAVTAQQIVTQMNKLQQISSGFVIDGDSNPRMLTDVRKMPKMQALLDLLDDMGDDNRMIVFCYYRFTAQYLHSLLTKHIGQPPAVLIGKGSRQKEFAMSEDDLREHKRRFNEDPNGPKVMVAQLSAGGVGHTLLGTPNRPCHTVTFYENSYSLIDRDQAEDRPHRFGQTHAVSYYDISSSPAETRAIAALHRKESIAHALVDARHGGMV